jgi:hypothetical protein
MKKYLYDLDYRNRFVEFYEFNEENFKKFYLHKTIELSDEDLKKVIVGGKVGLVNGKIVTIEDSDDEIKQNNKTLAISTIESLKRNLIQTDYKVIKCYEAQLLNEPMPYDLPALLAERKAWRNEINTLEFELSMLG